MDPTGTSGAAGGATAAGAVAGGGARKTCGCRASSRQPVHTASTITAIARAGFRESIVKVVTAELELSRTASYIYASHLHISAQPASLLHAALPWRGALRCSA